MELNSLTICDVGINFISRTRKNNGIKAVVKKVKNISPYDKGLITVACGSDSVMESFVQFKPFYTGRDVYVLKPKKYMTIQEKIYICMCLRKNKYKYNYGRQANRTLKDLEIPETIPEWVNKLQINIFKDLKNTIDNNASIILEFSQKRFKEFNYYDLFDFMTGGCILIKDSAEGKTPLVSATVLNNSIVKYIDRKPTYSGNKVTIIKNGNGTGEAFYQPIPFCITTDVIVLKPKFSINVYSAMFLITLIKKEKYRYSYGRKWTVNRMKKSILKLPVDNNEKPDWCFMEEFIKSLRWSKGL